MEENLKKRNCKWKLKDIECERYIFINYGFLRYWMKYYLWRYNGSCIRATATRSKVNLDKKSINKDVKPRQLLGSGVGDLFCLLANYFLWRLDFVNILDAIGWYLKTQLKVATGSTGWENTGV